ncbi:hypothetical protein V2J09_017315 [Rumex salicifolius]
MGAKQQEEMIIQNQPSPRNPDAVPISRAQFLAWKQQKDEDAAARRAEEARKREEDVRSGSVQMNGRELFIHEPWVLRNEDSTTTINLKQARR